MMVCNIFTIVTAGSCKCTLHVAIAIYIHVHIVGHTIEFLLVSSYHIYSTTYKRYFSNTQNDFRQIVIDIACMTLYFNTIKIIHNLEEVTLIILL